MPSIPFAAPASRGPSCAEDTYRSSLPSKSNVAVLPPSTTLNPHPISPSRTPGSTTPSSIPSTNTTTSAISTAPSTPSHPLPPNLQSLSFSSPARTLPPSLLPSLTETINTAYTTHQEPLLIPAHILRIKAPEQIGREIGDGGVLGVYVDDKSPTTLSTSPSSHSLVDEAPGARGVDGTAATAAATKEAVVVASAGVKKWIPRALGGEIDYEVSDGRLPSHLTSASASSTGPASTSASASVEERAGEDGEGEEENEEGEELIYEIKLVACAPQPQYQGIGLVARLIHSLEETILTSARQHQDEKPKRVTFLLCTLPELNGRYWRRRGYTVYGGNTGRAGEWGSGRDFWVDWMKKSYTIS